MNRSVLVFGPHLTTTHDSVSLPIVDAGSRAGVRVVSCNLAPGVDAHGVGRTQELSQPPGEATRCPTSANWATGCGLEPYLEAEQLPKSGLRSYRSDHTNARRVELATHFLDSCSVRDVEQPAATTQSA